FADGKMRLGTWQQVVFIDFDNRARSRTVALQFQGE
ncbi:MAG TPA: YjbQ family protein, partial [Candidatus Aminicenantes bacterium]|nr:YjbQ family protein [Candidatus Aminicenantes bacterium]